MALPNPSMSFSPFAILTAEEMNNLVENITALADWSAYTNNTLPYALLIDSSIPATKLNLLTLAPAVDANGWSKQPYDGTKYRYVKTFTGSTGSVAAGGGSPNTLVNSTSLPVGVASLATAIVTGKYSVEDSTSGGAWLIFGFGYISTAVRVFVRNGYGGGAITANYIVTLEIII